MLPEGQDNYNDILLILTYTLYFKFHYQKVFKFYIKKLDFRGATFDNDVDNVC